MPKGCMISRIPTFMASGDGMTFVGNIRSYCRNLSPMKPVDAGTAYVGSSGSREVCGCRMSCKAMVLPAQDLGGVWVIIDVLEPEIDLFAVPRDLESKPKIGVQSARMTSTHRTAVKLSRSHCICITRTTASPSSIILFRRQMTDVNQQFPKLVPLGIVCNCIST